VSKKGAEAEKPENHERWIVSYADMLTLLFALFVVLYATGDPNVKKLQSVRNSIDQAFNVGVKSGDNGASPLFDSSGGGIAPTMGEIKSRAMVDLSSKMNGFAQAKGIDGRVQVKSDATSITITLADNLLFGSGSADLKPGSQDVLTQVADVLKGLPNNIRIEGHTDNIPISNSEFSSNWELSAARAARVLRFLDEQGGVTPSKLSLAGYADTRPIADNTTAEGRALNRRADIVIIYPSQEELQQILGSAGTKGR
jgi:chemotaxis protein MotB